MIKINLALKKQAAYLSKDSPSGGSSGLSTMKDALTGEGAKALLSSLAIPVILSLGAYFGSDYYTNTKIEEMKAETDKAIHEKESLQKEITRIKGFEQIKTEVETNQKILANKIDTIERLVRGRDFAVKSMVVLAQSMPKELWLSEFQVSETGYELKGSASDISHISDFMTHLGQTIYYKDVTLKTSSLDTNGRQSNFELSARRE